MDCSMHEASHIEQSIAPKMHFLEPLGRIGVKIPYIRVFFGVSETA